MMASEEVRVLIVDDNRALAQSLAELLDRRAFRTFLAHRAATALRVARRFRPHVVVADVQLPDSAGPELVEGLARVAPETPVILITAAGGPSAAPARLNRVFATLDKPFDPLRLVALVRRAAEALLRTVSAAALPVGSPRAAPGRRRPAERMAFPLVPVRRLLPAWPSAVAPPTLARERLRSRMLAVRAMTRALGLDWQGRQ